MFLATLPDSYEQIDTSLANISVVATLVWSVVAAIPMSVSLDELKIADDMNKGWDYVAKGGNINVVARSIFLAAGPCAT